MENMHEYQRLKGLLDFLDLEKLERETRRFLYLGIVVAVAIHLALGSYFMFRKTEVKVVKPPTMELVIRQPRMTKPFELRKERVMKREYRKRDVEKRIVPATEITLKTRPYSLLGTVESFDYRADLDIEEGDGGADFVPIILDIELETVRTPSRQISMKEELITIDDLDTGQYKGLVIQDPYDRRNIRGFVYIGILWGTMLEPDYTRGLIHLSDALNKYTRIRSKVDRHLFLDSRRLFDTPFVYLCVKDRFELTEIEAKNFGDYLRNGGFAVLDNAKPQVEMSPGEASLRRMIRQSLGNDGVLMPIPRDHPLYHCFFDFDVPVLGIESRGYSSSGESLSIYQGPIEYLEGVWIDNRLVLIYCDKAYGEIWDRDYDNEPQLKMGVNMVVFALTQQGGIAERKMEIYSTVQ